MSPCSHQRMRRGVTVISNRMKYQSENHRIAGLLVYIAPAGWRQYTRMTSFSKPPIEVLISSGATASPCTKTAGGSTSPLPVESEKSSETRGLRRMLRALSGRPIEVVVMNWPVEARKNGSIGQVIGVLSAARVENAQVRHSQKTAPPSAGIGRAISPPVVSLFRQCLAGKPAASPRKGGLTLRRDGGLPPRRNPEYGSGSGHAGQATGQIRPRRPGRGDQRRALRGLDHFGGIQQILAWQQLAPDTPSPPPSWLALWERRRAYPGPPPGQPDRLALLRLRSAVALGGGCSAVRPTWPAHRPWLLAGYRRDGLAPELVAVAILARKRRLFAPSLPDGRAAVTPLVAGW